MSAATIRVGSGHRVQETEIDAFVEHSIKADDRFGRVAISDGAVADFAPKCAASTPEGKQ
jgi:hypothetical protein